jgi:shikimate dehydrogenase
MAKQFAVIGDPISHSLSPKIHAAAYKALGLDWQYGAVQVPKGQLASFISENKDRYSGLSVTMPLKIEANKVAGSLDDLTTLTGVTNTLLFTGGIKGFNTDVFGIRKALGDSWSTSKRVAILGAGATARSAIAAVSAESPNAAVTVFARATLKATELIALGKSLGVVVNLKELAEFSNHQEITINTLPGGAISVATDHQSGWLLSANYSEADKSFVENFDEQKTISGIEMLLWQAVGQIRIFLSGDSLLPIENEGQMLEAMRKAL